MKKEVYGLFVVVTIESGCISGVVILNAAMKTLIIVMRKTPTTT